MRVRLAGAALVIIGIIVISWSSIAGFGEQGRRIVHSGVPFVLKGEDETAKILDQPVPLTYDKDHNETTLTITVDAEHSVQDLKLTTKEHVVSTMRLNVIQSRATFAAFIGML